MKNKKQRSRRSPIMKAFATLRIPILKVNYNHSFLFILFMIFGIATFAQTGGVQGKVIDKFTQELIPYASVILENQQGTQVAGVASSMEGNYLIENVQPGKYRLKVMYIGYETAKHPNIRIVSDTIVDQDIELIASAVMEQEVMIINGVGRSGGKNQRGKSVCPPTTNYFYMVDEDSAEEYDGIIENRFVGPKHHPLSTFSIDVDVASYSNVRRFLNDGYMPQVDAVRTEEMINYFTYDYPEPPLDIPVEITAEVAQCDWNPKHKIALVGLQAEKIETENLPPSNLVFLLDVSGSMSDYDKLPLLQKSMRMLVNNLDENDKVSIVVYAGSAGLVLKPTHGHNKEKILSAIDKLNAGGSTAGGEGIELAYQIAEKQFIQHGNNRIILATDGDFNVGISDDDDLVKLIEEKRETGIFLTVLGFGQGNLKDSKMEKLADHGNGNYAYIDNLLEAQKVLVNEMGATLVTVAKDVKIQIEFNPEKVQAYRLIGYENRLLQDEDFNNDMKDAGEIGAGKSVTALYEIIPVGVDSNFELGTIDDLKYQKSKHESLTDFADEMMTVKVRYKLPKGNKSFLLEKPVNDKVVDFSKASNNLRFASSVAEFAMLLRDSEYKGSASYNHLIEIASKAKGVDEEGYRAEYIRLIKLANQIQLTSMHSDSGK